VITHLVDGVALHPKVTYLIGENGSGKSTLLEAIAVAAGINPEGGTSNFAFSTRDSHSRLWEDIQLTRGVRRPATDFFLRAEGLFTAATYLDELRRDDTSALASYGGVSLHEQSHGESFLAVMLNRFGPDGFYVMDEPEAALSTQNCLTCLRRIHQLVIDGSQFVIATHSPNRPGLPQRDDLQLHRERPRDGHLRRRRTGTPYIQLPLGARAVPRAAVRRRLIAQVIALSGPLPRRRRGPSSDCKESSWPCAGALRRLLQPCGQTVGEDVELIPLGVVRLPPAVGLEFGLCFR
jgi:predicted ATPase